jgi:hypothetical protein
VNTITAFAVIRFWKILECLSRLAMSPQEGLSCMKLVYGRSLDMQTEMYVELWIEVYVGYAKGTPCILLL